jgi:hypothetical protein
VALSWGTHVVDVRIVNKIPVVPVICVCNGSSFEKLRESKGMNGMIHRVYSQECLQTISGVCYISMANVTPQLRSAS